MKIGNPITPYDRKLAVHYWNGRVVQCRTKALHIRATDNVKRVTCKKCLDKIRLVNPIGKNNPLTRKRYERFIVLAWKAWDRYEAVEDPYSAKGNRLYLEYLRRRKVVEDENMSVHPSLRPRLPNPTRKRKHPVLVINKINGKKGIAVLTAAKGQYAHPVIVVQLEDGRVVEYHSIDQFYNIWEIEGHKNPDQHTLYESFHGTHPKGTRKVFYNPPKGKLVKIGRLSEIKYRPEYPSKFEGTEFYHKAGDLGYKVIKSNAILCTNKEGTQLYIVREDKEVKYPIFSDRGILG